MDRRSVLIIHLEKICVVSNNYIQIFLTYCEWTGTLTFGTRAWFNFCVLRLDKRSKNVVTFCTVVLHHRQLRQDSRSCRYHSKSSNQLIQVEFSVVTK
ncbi:hypothetical protein ALC57_06838 [Trachymyrmex cornetzi]|uniref:Uncharacterized protein n=1 Tax=Trachymyrmex cornetzi TaxID=471704 RepID=A0A195E758_9HYME|nr:hypothetical protein ALC57_06838 [Trachymyrmex cornetzi]